MTPGEIISSISALVALIAVYVTLTRNRSDYLSRKLEWEITQENRLATLETAIKSMTPINDRVVAIETKIGLFWHMVEQMPLKDHIRTSPQDIADAEIYDKLKEKSPTQVLVRLGQYLVQTIPERGADEKAFLLLKLGAIQAQLADRGVRLEHGTLNS